MMRLDEIQPSQLYISAVKLAKVVQELDPSRPEELEPIPVKRLGDQVLFTDGHTRAFAAFSCGLVEAPVFWDEDQLDWEAYEICVQWCKQEGIRTIVDLAGRIVPPEAYEELWLSRCAQMHRQLEAKRKRADDL